MVGPDFRGEEDVVAAHAGGAQAVADFALIVVDLRGIDVAIAEPQRLLDHAGGRPPAQLPGAEPDRRYPCAIGLDEQHEESSLLRQPRMSLWTSPVIVPTDVAGSGPDLQGNANGRFVSDRDLRP